MALGIFLFLKQIVDMFYKWQILDYGMVIFSLAVLLFGVIKEKKYKNIREHIKLVDIYIIGIAFLYFAAFLRNISGYQGFFKVESAIVLYFIGRVYGNKILDYGYGLAIAGYIVIYSNLVARFIHFGYSFVGENLTDGGVYYYKTDLAVGVIIASIFIYFFAKNKYFKWITILPISSYLVFYSQARMQQPILLFVYIAILIYEYKKKKQIEKASIIPYRIIIWMLIIIPLVVLIGTQFFPFEKYQEAVYATNVTGNPIESVMHSRQVYWFDLLHFFKEQPFLNNFIGYDMVTISDHNMKYDRSHSEYFQHLYVTGYLGTIIFILFWRKAINTVATEKNQLARRITTLFIVFFLLAGLTIECFELTQMSWFVFLFVGMLI